MSEMTEWIVPLAGILVFLFFCPGCFLWVWMSNRRTSTGQREFGAADGAALTIPPVIVTVQGDGLQGLAGGAA